MRLKFHYLDLVITSKYKLKQLPVENLLFVFFVQSAATVLQPKRSLLEVGLSHRRKSMSSTRPRCFDGEGGVLLIDLRLFFCPTSSNERLATRKIITNVCQRPVFGESPGTFVCCSPQLFEPSGGSWRLWDLRKTVFFGKLFF
mgnify:CR=1 FL=1